MNADSPSAASTPAHPPVKRREIFGWCCFDFANSAYVTIIVTVIYFPYFSKVVADDSANAAKWWGITLALAQLAVLLVSPLVGAMTDIRANKKTLLALTAAICTAATLALYYVGPGEIWFALGLVGFATAAFYLSENITPAFCLKSARLKPPAASPATAGVSVTSEVCSASCSRSS